MKGKERTSHGSSRFDSCSFLHPLLLWHEQNVFLFNFWDKLLGYYVLQTHFMEEKWKKKKSHFLPEGLKCMFCSLRNNTVNQHSSKWESQALEMANPAGKGWGIHLLIFNHTAQRSCAGSQPLLLALLRALQEWEPSLGVSTDTGPGQAHGFHQHFTISKCILPHRAYWARTFSPLLSLWDINLIMVGAFLTYRNKSAQGRPPVILWFFFLSLAIVYVKHNQHENQPHSAVHHAGCMLCN